VNNVFKITRAGARTEQTKISNALRELRQHHAVQALCLILTKVTLVAAVIAFAAQCLTAQSKKPDLPYVTIDQPKFIAASEATFLSAKDILIGVTDGKTAKAYPAAILAQHGVVQDQMADGPIAVTW
jgi:hypothetical protein